VLNGDKFFIFHRLNGNSVSVIYILSFKSRQSYTAAADKRSTCGMYNIATDGADIKFGKENV
jgi:hypothetical protein